MNELVMAFDSSQQALRTEMLLEDAAVEFELVPTPAEITAGCALCVAFGEDSLERVMTIVGEESIEIRGVFRKNGSAYDQTV
ncbi:DUF3343 domain-containing protein [Saccharibacillus alkalitolerans]|uniref:DUF3343 domain-containing protein n=1 Tax=Saccharibacillus alkalitolerans TaxID=2705290 RepID=A0ABX0FDU3_9BACL|nr:DUF3343 domain-containing protein [Saccharibacillus alkalitolerans]NGZ76602.1 DUF3343 domain-containing protein [Saccharibacillus alkalitolerans]